MVGHGMGPSARAPVDKVVATAKSRITICASFFTTTPDRLVGESRRYCSRPQSGADMGLWEFACSETRTKMMPLASAYEDLQQRTLSALPGLWERIRYLASLRSSAGGYRHWGLDRTFGERASQTALGAAHTQLFLQVLRTPLRQLVQEYRQAEEHPGELLDWSLFVPGDLAGGSASHFNSVVSALQALAADRRS